MKLILSCTTTINRLTIFYYGIQSLLNQTLKPDVFLINLCKDTFRKTNNANIPDWLNDDRITLNFVKDIGPYTKLIPAIEFAEEDDVIVTADDDILYHNKWLDKLYQTHRNNPTHIVCSRGRIITKNFFGRYMNYSNWKIISRKTTGMNILPLGVGGIVYKKKLLDLDFATDHSFLEFAPSTDDLWFRMASLKKSVPVIVVPEVNSESMSIKHEHGLEQRNIRRETKVNRIIEPFITLVNYVLDYLGIRRTKNDFAWKNILKYVGRN